MMLNCDDFTLTALLLISSFFMQETAISVFYPREDMIDQGYTTFGYMKMQLVVAHGGRCAEQLVFGDDITDGGGDDLEKITKVTIVLCLIICIQWFWLMHELDNLPTIYKNLTVVDWLR